MLYPRFLLTFSKNKYNNTKFCNEEFLRVMLPLDGKKFYD